MMKKLAFLVAGIVFQTLAAQAQYYYQDIITTQQAAANLALFKAHKVSKQVVRSLDAQQQEAADFTCVRTLNSSYRTMRALTSGMTIGSSSLTSTFNTKGLLIKAVDSSQQVINISTFNYDAAGNLTEVQFQSKGRGDKFQMKESRLFEYDSLGHLLRLQITKNGMAAVTVLFKTDSLGRVIEEAYPGRPRYFYEYDQSGQLSDILRYHPSRKRMLPDFSFTYHADGKLASMTTVQLEQNMYTIWSYVYDEKGLPKQEDCYGKGKELLGRIRYVYEYFKL
jgi:YD repeat-containing protein